MVLLVAYAFYYKNVFSNLYITTCHARDGVSDTPEHSNDIYLPSSSLIGDTDTVAWLRAARCTGTRPHRASQAAIACTASLHRTPPFQAAKSKALLVLSGRGAAVALVAARRDLDPSHLRTPHALMLGRRRPHAEGPCACGAVLGFVRRPPCGERQGSRIISARASKGVKSDRIRSPLNIKFLPRAIAQKLGWTTLLTKKHACTQPSM